MPKYAYQAFTETGSQVSGVVEAASVELAATILVNRGYIPTDVREQSLASSTGLLARISDGLSSVKAPELVLFTKQFRTLLRAGLPVLRLLQVLENQTENPKLKKTAASMAQDIREGAPLYDAFRKHPTVFNTLYCSMVRAGESSGAVPEVMDRLTYIIEHEHKIRSDIKSALQYPITVVIALSVAFFVLLTFVIPKFATIFQNAGLKLPLPTILCMAMYQFLTDYWYLCIGGCVLSIFGLISYIKTEKGRYAWDSFTLRIPIMGSLFVKSAMSRFASIFAILQSSGVPILDALQILSGTIGNAAISREFDRLKEKVEEGRGIAGPLGSARFFTPMVVNMIAVGEESGNMEDMLREVSVHYDDEVAYAVKGLTEAINPILMVCLTGMVGFFAMAIFLPMWDLTQIATKGH